MEVNKLESREVLTILFGVPVMITVIVLVSIAVGHIVTARSDRPTNVQVSAAAPKIDVNVPEAPAPQVQVATAAPKIDVSIPAAPPPTINVTPPPAVVTVLEREAPASRSADVVPSPASKETKAAPKAETIIDKPAEHIKPAPTPTVPVLPAKAAEAAKTSNAAPGSLPLEFGTEEATVDTLYKYAEKYIESYCAKNGLDVKAEAASWQKKWEQGLAQAMADNIDSDEQSYINRVVLAKRDCFDLEKATPEKIVEGCRIMLRYRDGKLALMKMMADAANETNIKKTLVVLAAGVR